MHICIHQRLADSLLNDVWAPWHRPHSHRQQTSSDPSGPFSTARAITVGVIRIAVQVHTSMASLSAMLSCGRPYAIKPPSSCLHLSQPPPSLRTSFMDDPWDVAFVFMCPFGADRRFCHCWPMVMTAVSCQLTLTWSNKCVVIVQSRRCFLVRMCRQAKVNFTHTVWETRSRRSLRSSTSVIWTAALMSLWKTQRHSECCVLHCVDWTIFQTDTALSVLIFWHNCGQWHHTV